MPLAAGGMARIYIGRATGIGSFERHVVLKLITPERANDQIAVQMFLDEARLAASLNHQNVAQVFEVGEDAGIHYLAMEYVHGQDLRALLAKAGSQGTRIPLELALTTVAGAAAGLNHAHERRGADGVPLGIVHRDVSPSNIMVGYDGSVKLLDFGIAKAASRSVETQSGIIKGKFAYMAPEQCRGRDVDRRSDVFSLGIILYEISTQHRCFRADSDFDTMHRIVTGDVVRPTRIVPSYPPALEAIVMKALAIDASQRYQSAGHLLEAIEAFAVASRLSLSTMGLGRFMRDMFGEVAEPWVGSARNSQPMIAAKENTISSTDGRSQAGPSPMLPPEPNSAEADSDPPEPSTGKLHDDAAPTRRADDADSGGLAKTFVMDPQRGRPSLSPSDWQSFGADPLANATPLPSGVEIVPPTVVMAPGPSSPVAIAAKIAPLPVPMPLAPAPAPPPGLPSTRHGYASGIGATKSGMTPSAPSAPSALSYPRYEPPPPEPEDVELRPNRTLLFAGAGLLVVGIFVVVALVVAGGSKDDGSAKAVPDPVVAPVAASIDAGVVQEFIPINIASKPSGADVLVADTKIGVTPFKGKLRRGTKVAPLVVHLDGYVDFTSKIDLGDGYTNQAIELAKVPERPPIAPTIPTPTPAPAPMPATGSASAAPAPAPTPTAPPPSDPDKHSATHLHPHSTSTTTPTPPSVKASHPAKSKCQPQGAVNPFDTSCDGHACPPCPN